MCRRVGIGSDRTILPGYQQVSCTFLTMTLRVFSILRLYAMVGDGDGP